MKSSFDYRRLVEASCHCCLIDIKGWRTHLWRNPKTGVNEMVDAPELEIGRKLNHYDMEDTKVLSVGALSESTTLWRRSLKGRWMYLKWAWRGYGADEFEFFRKEDLDDFIDALVEARKAIFD